MSGSPGARVKWRHFPAHHLAPGPMNPGCGRNSPMHWMLIQSVYSFLEHLAPATQGTATQLALYLSLQKAIPSVCQATFFGSLGDVVRLVNSMNTGPWTHFFCCEVSCLIRSKCSKYQWQIEVCGIPGGWIGHLEAHRGLFWQKHFVQGRHIISRVSVYSSEDRMLPLP